LGQKCSIFVRTIYRIPVMKSLRTLLLVSATLMLASCGATKYAPANHSFWTGNQGYSEVPLDNATWQITFCGNDQTPDQTVNQYALYRAAELASQQGFDYFVVMNDNDLANVTSTTNQNAQKQTDVEHTVDPQTGRVVPVAVTTTNRSTTTTTTAAHTVTISTRMFHGQRPADNPQAYDAKSMVSLMGPSIQR
ncbi:MAG TPA: hypothetical protein VGM92_05980, partial [Candidatus Kapabacteria bacterium]